MSTRSAPRPVARPGPAAAVPVETARPVPRATLRNPRTDRGRTAVIQARRTASSFDKPKDRA